MVVHSFIMMGSVEGCLCAKAVLAPPISDSAFLSTVIWRRTMVKDHSDTELYLTADYY